MDRGHRPDLARAPIYPFLFRLFFEYFQNSFKFPKFVENGINNKKVQSKFIMNPLE
jgi:hypothetical protein